MSTLEELDVKSLKSGYALIEDKLENVTSAFYLKLFADYPSVAPLFAHLPMEEQEKKLADSLRLVMNTLDKPDALIKALKALGARHQGY
ncbi:MAG: flavohemoprotein, partial [Lentisphaeraceae bacterium]|nr:flavohemoprotein [Lentisphaeraceae bacterium]